MNEPIIYLDHSEIVEGKILDLRKAINELVELFKMKEPRLVAYNVYFTEDMKHMTVLNVHPDPDSLEFHLRVFAPWSPKFTGLIKLLSIDIYGPISGTILEQINQKAARLGNGKVRVHKLQSGFNRLSIS